MKTRRRLRKPIRKRMWTNSQANQATKAGDVDAAELGDGCGAADGGQAAFVPVVEEGRSRTSPPSRKWRKGGAPFAIAYLLRESVSRRSVLAEWRPEPRREASLPCSSFTAARSPMTNTSGWPGRLRSGLHQHAAGTIYRQRPVLLPSGDAATPAAHSTTVADSRVSPRWTAPGSI